MRTSLVEIARIDSYLLGDDAPEDALIMQARLALDDDLKANVNAQKSAHNLVVRYGRQKLRQEIQAVEARLFTSAKHRSFRDQIKSIFKF